MTHPLIEAVARSLHDINNEISNGKASWESQEVGHIYARAAVLATLHELRENIEQWSSSCAVCGSSRQRHVVDVIKSVISSVERL